MLDITPYYLFLKGSKTSNHEEANSDEQKFIDGEINWRCSKSNTSAKGYLPKTRLGIFIINIILNKHYLVVLGSISLNFFCQAKSCWRTHIIWQKNCCSISPTIYSPDFRLKSIEKLANLCAVCQALFAKKASHLVYEKKSCQYVGEKKTPEVNLTKSRIGNEGWSVFKNFKMSFVPTEN